MKASIVVVFSGEQQNKAEHCLLRNENLSRALFSEKKKLSIVC